MFVSCFSVVQTLFPFRSLEKYKMPSLAILLCDTRKSVSYSLRQIFHSLFFANSKKLFSHFSLTTSNLTSEFTGMWRAVLQEICQQFTLKTPHLPHSLPRQVFSHGTMEATSPLVKFHLPTYTQILSSLGYLWLFMFLPYSSAGCYLKYLSNGCDIITDHNGRHQMLNISPPPSYNELSFSSTTLSIYPLYMNSLFTALSNNPRTLMITKYRSWTCILI